METNTKNAIDYFVPFEELDEEHEMTIGSLCSLLIDNSLLDDYRLFFDIFLLLSWPTGKRSKHSFQMIGSLVQYLPRWQTLSNP